MEVRQRSRRVPVPDGRAPESSSVTRMRGVDDRGEHAGRRNGVELVNWVSWGVVVRWAEILRLALGVGSNGVGVIQTC